MRCQAGLSRRGEPSRGRVALLVSVALVGALAASGSMASARNAVDVYLKLRGEQAVGPMILVFPGLTAESRDVHSCGVNMRAPGDTPSLGTGRFEDYLVQDLIP
jgi:hypothetical protein